MTIGDQLPKNRKGNTRKRVAFKTTWGDSTHAAAVVEGDGVSLPLVVAGVADSVFGFSDVVDSSEELLLLAGEVDFPA